MDKIVVGLIENVEINGVQVTAKIDTGADRSSVCESLVNKLSLSPTGEKKIIKSSSGAEKREIYEAELKIKNKTFHAKFTIAQREHLNFSVLIGNDILTKGFIVDPSK